MAEIGTMTRCGQEHSGAALRRTEKPLWAGQQNTGSTLRVGPQRNAPARGARILVVVLASAMVAACHPKPQSPPQGPPSLPSPAPGPSKKPTTPPGPQSKATGTRTAVAAVEAAVPWLTCA